MSACKCHALLGYLCTESQIFTTSLINVHYKFPFTHLETEDQKDLMLGHTFCRKLLAWYFKPL